MENSKYDKSSVSSIYEFAVKLIGKTLSEAVILPEDVANSRNRGDLGSLVEKYYFEHTPPNNHDPDFKEAGLELKTTGVLIRSERYRAKERLVLTMINYEVIVTETWEKSSFYNKCKLMLILFYLYTKEKAVVDRKFVMSPLLYEIPSDDEQQIKRDWEFIQQRVLDGRAHELSEGDTFYLAACRKGSGGEDEALRKQPFSDQKAKARAFSFKQSYVNKLIDGELERQPVLGINQSVTFEGVTQSKFAPYIGKTVEELSSALSYHQKSTNHKGFLKDIVNRILVNDEMRPLELDKAGIEIKTIRLTKNGSPREAMSFPGFKYLEIIDEKWEDSSFFDKLEHKFLFVIFRVDENNVERLKKVSYWNMPYTDRLEAQRVWEETKRRVSLDASDLPRSSESAVAHVRPKARDGNDKLLTPQGDLQVKKCFWLNKDYIAGVVEKLV
jgi:DNA mismatch repair protein MutH